MDATGNGSTLAEYTADKYGQNRINQVMLNDAWYRENMISFQRAFEDQSIDIPKDADILNDVRALEMIDGIIKLPKIHTADTKNIEFKRHGDSGIALALAWFASKQDSIPAACVGQNPAKHESPMGRSGMPQHKGGFFGRFGQKVTIGERAA